MLVTAAHEHVRALATAAHASRILTSTCTETQSLSTHADFGMGEGISPRRKFARMQTGKVRAEHFTVTRGSPASLAQGGVKGGPMEDEDQWRWEGMSRGLGPLTSLDPSDTWASPSHVYHRSYHTHQRERDSVTDTERKIQCRQAVFGGLRPAAYCIFSPEDRARARRKLELSRARDSAKRRTQAQKLCPTAQRVCSQQSIANSRPPTRRCESAQRTSNTT